ncbi:hypothetical protein BG000_007246 [Podila horticola]|nr:hypothetical protein BG000_007246 [Podila horticola]
MFFLTRSELSQAAIQREISVLQELRHRHIIQFYEQCELNGNVYLVMDLAENGSLASAIEKDTLIKDWPTKTRLAHEIARGLEYIHLKKVIHRDLKSANVLLTKHMEVKLADFGLAAVRTTTSSMSSVSSDSPKGTWRWLAPELLVARPKYSSRSDMYALGMVMWEMAASCTMPFSGQLDTQVVMSLVKDGEREVLPDDTPSEYRKWVELCWNHDPLERPDAKMVVLVVNKPLEQSLSYDGIPTSVTFDDSLTGEESNDGQVEATRELSVVSPSISSADSSGGSPSISNEAAKWYHKAAKQEEPHAQQNLGFRYQKGLGVERSNGEAANWFPKADKQEEIPEETPSEHHALIEQRWDQDSAKQPKASEVVLVDDTNENDVEDNANYPSFTAETDGSSFVPIRDGPAHVEGGLKRMSITPPSTASAVSQDSTSSATEIKHSVNGLPGEMEDSSVWLQKAAEGGDADAQFNLGLMYVNGEGVHQSYSEAFSWLQRAADQGNPDAQFNLAVMYDSGKGVEPSTHMAISWFRRAAEQGHSEAHLSLGKRFFTGKGVPQSFVEAALSFRRAAELGDAEAQFNLATMLKNGEGTEVDVEEAIVWYRKAAQQDLAQAQYNLGVQYKVGEGVEQNYVEANSWFLKAARQGYSLSQFQLGLSYYAGLGVQQSNADALAWVHKAATQGHSKAQFVLSLLLKQVHEAS